MFSGRGQCGCRRCTANLRSDVSAHPSGLRKFFQAQSQIVRHAVPSDTRLIDYEAAEEFCRAALGEEDPLKRDRLNRAIQQYVLALRYWNLEQRVLSVGHAFMAAEALTALAKRSMGKSDVELANLEKHDKHIKYTRRARDIPNAADSRARREVTFHGDSTTLRGAKNLSDGFEHGYGDYEMLKTLAHQHGESTLHHVRRAIIELSGIRAEVAEQLLSSKYDQPVPLFSLLAVFGHFSDITEEHISKAPLELSGLTSAMESYDEETGAYKVKIMSNFKVIGPIPIAVTEIRARH